ncbi:MAG: DUF4011 domain-containing protein, partial [Beijerinckiaceae bacterium]
SDQTRNNGAGKILRTALETEPLQKRLLSLYRDAKTAEEEQGINILFLAIGFLQWFEDDKSDVKREAPLILIPVNLVRDKLRSTFDLKLRESDIATNQAIKVRLHSDFGIALPEIPDDEEWTPVDYFTEVRLAISLKARWTIDENSAELGFYSFSKLLMIRDLEPESWPDDSLLNHPLLRGLLSEGFAAQEPLFADDARIDALFQPKDLVQVVDADSSQTLVIETVRAGRNLVVQGPPGTGKSQTISNIIAAAVHDGKTVLFVAEKMAGLNVVHDRLRKTGLGGICLELHSRGANKRLIAEELDRTLGSFTSPKDASSDLARLTLLRDQLNDTASKLHAPVGDTGWSGFRALSEQITDGGQIVVADGLLEEVSNWNANVYSRVELASRRLAELTAAAGPRNSHLFSGVRSSNLQPSDIARLLPQWQSLSISATSLSAHLKEMSEFLALSGQPTKPQEVTDLVIAAIRSAGVRAVLLSGWGGLASLPESDDVFCADALPHDWLFPRVAAAVHHGGAGTTGAALSAGIPALVIPFAADQPFWGKEWQHSVLGLCQLCENG